MARNRPIAAKYLPYGEIMKPFLRNGLLAVAIAAFAFWWFKPGYIELDVPVMKHKGGGAFWWEQHYSQITYADSPGTFYVHRRVGTAYPHTQGWTSVEEVFAHFDRLLDQRGWGRTGVLADNPVMPESRLLPPAGLRAYYRPHQYLGDATILMAVWPIGGATEGFHVVLTTVNPSLLRRVSRAMD
ncbi:hypothetical protein CQ12_25590 [Bradyrhizobium jicamae]|uniref:Uncharacterized protein n=2 Tax=Bradyrhizobium jicamae TaxID=280332 RepID=A0A0R3KFX4_9BRAD|nr:hypothetical protein CQ12_25590 [Bradyrhizobium jicamae]